LEKFEQKDEEVQLDIMALEVLLISFEQINFQESELE
jgi:hypothetical protein